MENDIHFLLYQNVILKEKNNSLKKQIRSLKNELKSLEKTFDDYKEHCDKFKVSQYELIYKHGKEKIKLIETKKLLEIYQNNIKKTFQIINIDSDSITYKILYASKINPYDIIHIKELKKTITTPFGGRSNYSKVLYFLIGEMGSFQYIKKCIKVGISNDPINRARSIPYIRGEELYIIPSLGSKYEDYFKDIFEKYRVQHHILELKNIGGWETFIISDEIKKKLNDDFGIEIEIKEVNDNV